MVGIILSRGLKINNITCLCLKGKITQQYNTACKIPYNIQNNTEQGVTRQYGTTLYIHNTIQDNKIQHSTVQQNKIQYNTKQQNTIQHKTIQYNTTKYKTTQSIRSPWKLLISNGLTLQLIAPNTLQCPFINELREHLSRRKFFEKWLPVRRMF